jgi:hypothetical protein
MLECLDSRGEKQFDQIEFELNVSMSIYLDVFKLLSSVCRSTGQLSCQHVLSCPLAAPILCTLVAINP